VTILINFNTYLGVKNLSGEYFTSASDYQTENEFTWCALNQTLTTQSSISWAQGEPSAFNLLGAKEDCVTVSLHTGVNRKNVLLDVDCMESQKYICEARRHFK